MDKRSSTARKDDRDDKVAADEADARRAAARLLGSLGGKKGGPARAAKLSAKRRAQIARKAAQTRWRVKAD